VAIDTVKISDLIQTQIQKILIQPLFDQASTFLSLGVRVFQTASPISIPTINGTFSPGWVAEAGLIAVEDADMFDSVSLLPSTMDSLKSIVTITNESLRQSSLALDSVIPTRLLTDFARKVDARAWSADGDGVNQPKGLLGWAGTTPLAVTGDLNPDDLMDAQAIALAANIPPGNLKFVMHPDTFSGLRKIRAFEDGRYLIEPDLTKGAGFTLLGTPVTLTSHLPATKTLLLDPQAIAVAVDLNPGVKILSERYAEFDLVGIRVVVRLDFKAVAPASIIVLTTAP
jgi:HK97 family phage major capsid protein